MKPILHIIIGLLLALPALAAVQTQVVEYKHGDDVLEGYLAYDDAIEGKRPGILVVHEWKGLNDYAKGRAEKLAALGYVAFAVDMYGKGIRAKDHEEAGKLSGIYRKDRQLMRARIKVALDLLRENPRVDAKRIAAIGYCFGGTTVLELARSGADVSGVVSFHGGLSTPTPEDAKNIKCKVLVCHGADDPFISADDIRAFQEEMRAGGVNWDMIFYGRAVHSFTVPAAGSDPSKGMAYHEQADGRSWEAMKDFFAEIFK